MVHDDSTHVRDDTPLPTRSSPLHPPGFSLKAKLTAAPPAGASHDSWKSSVPRPSTTTVNNDDDNSSWEFPDLLVTSEALAAEMLAESMATASATTSGGTFRLGGTTMHGGSSAGGGSTVGGGHYKRWSSTPVPPPPEFSLAAGDVDLYRLVLLRVVRLHLKP